MAGWCAGQRGPNTTWCIAHRLIVSLSHTQTPAQAAASFRQQHADVYAAAAAGSCPIEGALALAQPSSSMLEEARDWWWKFRALLQRNLQAYVRNPANVLGRFLTYQGVAMLTGTYMYKIGSIRGLLGLNIFVGECVLAASFWDSRHTHTRTFPNANFLFLSLYMYMNHTASIFFTLLAQEMFPFISHSLFVFSRMFHAIENAAGLYPPSCYYMSMVLIELVLNTVNGGLMAAYIYHSNNFSTFFNPERPWVACAGWTGFAMLLNAVTNVR